MKNDRELLKAINLTLYNKFSFRLTQYFIYLKTRMATSIKAILNKSDKQTNLDKYRVTAQNISEYHFEM